MYMCIYKYIYILYIHICVWGGVYMCTAVLLIYIL